jgi:hypothetical protein
MKKLFYILLVLGICIFSACLYFGFFTPYNSFTAKRDIKNGIYRIIDTVMTPACNEKKIIAEWLGFQYVKSTDSNISISGMNGIRSYNNLMAPELSKRLGDGWIKTWDRRTDSLFRVNNYERMKSAVLEFPEIKEYAKFLDSLSNGKEKPFVILFPLELEGNAHVGRLNKDHSVNVFFNYTIDPYTLQSENIKY